MLIEYILGLLTSLTITSDKGEKTLCIHTHTQFPSSMFYRKALKSPLLSCASASLHPWL